MGIHLLPEGHFGLIVGHGDVSARRPVPASFDRGGRARRRRVSKNDRAFLQLSTEVLQTEASAK